MGLKNETRIRKFVGKFIQYIRSVTLPEPPEEFMGKNPPGWIIELEGHGLPHGSKFTIRVQIRGMTRAGIVDIHYFPRLYDPDSWEKEFTSDLERSKITVLLDLLETCFPQQIKNASSMIRDGLRIRMTIYHREPYSVISARCNLSDVYDRLEDFPPATRIGNVLMDIDRRVQGDDWYSWNRSLTKSTFNLPRPLEISSRKSNIKLRIASSFFVGILIE